MQVRSKVLITVVLVASVAAILVLKVENDSILQGQIFNGPKDETVTDADNSQLPDLIADLEVIYPEQEYEDLVVKTTISNIGEGTVSGESPFSYKIFMNDQEVLKNSDSYSELLPGDSFSFEYPIPRTIYQYPNEGVLKVIVDSEGELKETDEGNNELEKEYNL